MAYSAAAAKSLQSCPTLYDPIDSSPSGSPIPGILQARTLVWVAISFSNAWKWKVKVKPLSCVRLLATPWTAAYQAPPHMGFSRQEYWRRVPLPSPTYSRCSIYMDKVGGQEFKFRFAPEACAPSNRLKGSPIDGYVHRELHTEAKHNRMHTFAWEHYEQEHLTYDQKRIFFNLYTVKLTFFRCAMSFSLWADFC